MSTETQQDIESEIGKHGNGLVRKLALVVLIPTLLGAVWVGALGNTVENQGNEIATLRVKSDAQAKYQAAILANQENIKEQLAEIRRNSRARQW